jgi:hypothetical protein
MRGNFSSYEGAVLDNLKKLVVQIGYQSVAVNGLNLNSSTLTREGAFYIRGGSLKMNLDLP